MKKLFKGLLPFVATFQSHQPGPVTDVAVDGFFSSQAPIIRKPVKKFYCSFLRYIIFVLQTNVNRNFYDYGMMIKKLLKRTYNIMPNEEIRSSFGKRLKNLRKQKKWTQKELAGMLNIGFSQFNKYEIGLHIPPIEKLIHLSELLDTSLDYLLTGNKENKNSLHNTRLLKRFQALEKIDAEEQEATIKFLDAMIMKNQIQGTLTSLDDQRQ